MLGIISPITPLTGKYAKEVSEEMNRNISKEEV
jgi:hypothetical protein